MAHKTDSRTKTTSLHPPPFRPPPWPIAYGAVPGRAGDACDPAWDASCFEGVRPVSIACSLPSACIWSVISRIISMVTWSGLAFRFRFGFRLRFGLGFGLELGLGLGLGLGLD